MCGICGIASFGRVGEDIGAVTARMRDRLRHRGPDGDGLWVDPGGRVALGHTRLAILDPGEGGAQPKASADGRWVITYNGEVYNHRALRARLRGEGVALRSGSDTEVLVEGIATWGLDETLRRAAGMFAFAAWDRREGVLHLARDRFGKKPIYVAARGERVAFASQLCALLEWRDLAPRIDEEAAAELLAYGCVRGERSVLEGVFRLPPASRLRIAAAADARAAATFRYWEPRALLARRERLLEGDDARWQVEQVLGTAVEERMIADVPVGALLSGGIDSSLVVAMMCERASGPVHTFSIGFAERDYDEAGHAAAVARHLGTEHTPLYVTDEEALAVVHEVAGVFDEPFADSSQIPTLLVSRLTRRHVKVALSGDGGDEVFGGYHRHVQAARIESFLRRVPAPARRATGALLASVRPSLADRAAATLGPRRGVLQGAGDRVHRLAWLVGAADADDLYDRALRLARRGLGLREPARRRLEAAAVTPAERCMYRDLLGYLPDDILVKVDRASMSCGLEVRSPLLDHRVVETAWRLAPRDRAEAGEGKQVLRRMLAARVPPRLFQRPKAGFAAPLHAWLRGPLRDWAQELLDPEALRADGFVDAQRTAAAWRAHQCGQRNLQHALWPVVMWRAWRMRWDL